MFDRSDDRLHTLDLRPCDEYSGIRKQMWSHPQYPGMQVAIRLLRCQRLLKSDLIDRSTQATPVQLLGR
tara:strand:+ start:999 stop:1205 length:207 start_codon:yes stop_codon:yes gene_type:complete